jgi:hypothetical protein
LCGNAERRRCSCGSGHVHRLARHQRRGPVSAAALKKVQAAVEQLNFRPSSIGRSLSSKSLGMIGIYTPSFFGAYYGTILSRPISNCAPSAAMWWWLPAAAKVTGAKKPLKPSIS